MEIVHNNNYNEESIDLKTLELIPIPKLGEPSVCGIYILIVPSDSSDSGFKGYVGQSVDIGRRINEHYQRNEQQIDKAITKHGIANTVHGILELCTPEELDSKEEYWIRKLNTLIPNGHNISLIKGVRGEDNASSKLTNEDVVYMRELYNSKNYFHIDDIYIKHYQHKIAYIAFFQAFHGDSWKHIMPEVFTDENRAYYESTKKENYWQTGQCGENNVAALLTEKDVMVMRKMYVTNERKAIFEAFPQYTERTIVSILSGQNWRHLPIYHKRKGIWTLNGGPWNEHDGI